MEQTQSISQSADTILHELPVAYTEVDAAGILRVVNNEACRMMGMTAEEMIGHSIWEFVSRDEATQDRSDFFRIMELGEDPPMIRRSLLSASGEYRTHELHRRMLRDSSGNPVGICCATFDVSEIESAHRDARQAKQWLESVIEAIPQAVIVTDALGFVRFSNPAAEALTGWPAQEQLGKQIEKVIPILRYNSTNQGTPSFRMALREPWNGDVELLNRERQTVSTWLSASPIVDRESGYTNGIVIVLRSRPVRVAS